MSRKASRLPVGTLTGLAAVYMLFYLVCERAGWGSTELRDLLGNVAFMPLNLTVVILNALASRNQESRPGGATGAPTAGARLRSWSSSATASRSTTSRRSARTRRSAGPTRSISPISFLMLAALLSFPLARRIRLERWKFVLDAAMVLVGGGVAIWYFTVRPTTAAAPREQRDGRHRPRLRLSAGEPAAAARRHDGAAARSARREPPGVRPAGASACRSSIVADLTFDLVLLADRRPERGLDRRGLPAALPDADRERASCTGDGRSPRSSSVSAAHRARLQPLSPLPYLAVAYHLRPAAHCGARARGPIRSAASRVGAVLMTVLVVARQLLGGAAERAPPGGERRAAERGPVPLAGAALVRRHHGHQAGRHHPVRQPLGDPGAALRSGGRCMGRALIDLLHPEDRERARTFLRDAATDARRLAAGRVAVPPAPTARRSARRPSRPTCWTIRPCAASCSTPAT